MVLEIFARPNALLPPPVRGNLEVLQKFWRFEVPRLVGRIPHAPPLLIYADLMATGDARNLETAKLLRERFLGDA